MECAKIKKNNSGAKRLLLVPEKLLTYFSKWNTSQWTFRHWTRLR